MYISRTVVEIESITGNYDLEVFVVTNSYLYTVKIQRCQDESRNLVVLDRLF